MERKARDRVSPDALNDQPKRCLGDLNIRRAKFSSFTIEDDPGVNLRCLLTGTWQVDHVPVINAFSPLSNRTVELESDDIALLARLTATTYVPVRQLTGSDETDEKIIDRLLDAGLLVSDSDEPCDADWRGKEERLSAVGWHAAAVSYHFSAKWGMSLPETGVEARSNKIAEIVNPYDAIAAAYGDVPPHFYSVSSKRSVNLPTVETNSGVFDTLKKRRSVRLFDASRPLSLEKLSTVLHYVFGCFGWSRLSDTLVSLKKCSPSGGGLHSTEAYLLVTDVEKTRPGIYHYNVQNHRLDEISEMNADEARNLAVTILADQHYMESAPVLVVFVSRFDRLFWKYRNHIKAYKVSLMDAAHLSQTFYLVCESLDLGACFTGAVRDTVIEEHFNLDPATQGVAGICICGNPSTEPDADEIPVTPYAPEAGEI